MKGIGILLITFILSQNSFGCDCLFQGVFLNVASKDVTVFQGTIIGYDVYVNGINGELYPTVMIVQVNEVILKNNPNSWIYKDSSKYYNEIIWANWFNSGSIKTVRILGNYNSSCRANITSFPIGSEYLFALTMEKKRLYFYDIDFTISNCGEYWVPVKDNIVYGMLTQENENSKETQEMSLGEIKERIKALR